jgi:hypothetical protein
MLSCHVPGAGGSVSNPVLETVRSAQLSHVSAVLRQIQTARAHDPNIESPPALFLGRDEGSHFWELLAFRVRGHGSLVIGAVRFPRQPSKQDANARRSLIPYLCQPPKELGLSGTARPASMIEVLLPEADEAVSTFLERLRNGQKGRSLFLDAESIAFAFDFRVDNPSEDRHLRINQKPTEIHVVRTVSGHVLSGYSEGLHTKLHKDGNFLALSKTVQHTPTRKLLLPNLALHRSFMAMEAVCSSEAPLEAWTERSVPFLAAFANPRHLLEIGS